MFSATWVNNETLISLENEINLFLLKCIKIECFLVKINLYTEKSLIAVQLKKKLDQAKAKGRVPTNTIYMVRDKGVLALKTN